MEDKCKTCIFRPGNLMTLQPGRVKEMVTKAKAQPDGAGSIVCHSTLDKELQAVCRGFYDAHATPLLQVAGRMNMIAYHSIDPEDA